MSPEENKNLDSIVAYDGSSGYNKKISYSKYLHTDL